MTLTGILKNILLVIISVMIWRTPISPIQFLGYAVALAGLVYYSLGWDQMVALSQTALVYARGGYEAVRGSASSSSSDGTSDAEGQSSGLTSAVRRALIMGAAAFTIMVLAGGFYYGRGGGSMVGEQIAGTGAEAS